MVVSSGALMAVAHNRRLAARAEDAPEAARDLSPLRVQDAPAVPSQEPPEQVPEGGADLGPDIDLSGLVEALRELQADGGVSGKKLAAAMERRGVKVDERAARAALAMLRPSNPSSNGDDMSPGPTDSPIRERIRAAEPATA